jgi:hypothetical protein
VVARLDKIDAMSGAHHLQGLPAETTFAPSEPRAAMALLPAMDDVTTIAAVLALGLAGWAINQRFDVECLRPQVAVAAGALTSSVALAEAWRRWPENMRRGVALALAASAAGAWIALA